MDHASVAKSLQRFIASSDRSSGGDVRERGPGIATALHLASAGWRRQLAAPVPGTEAFVEPSRLVVLFQDPEVQTAVGVVGATPRRDVRHQPRADAAPVAR